MIALEDDAELEQGSEAWAKAKLGKFSASRMGDLMAKGQGKTRAGYLLEIVAERLSGIPCGFEGNDDTDFGHTQEPFARRTYEDREGVFVEQVGFVVHPTLLNAGASPDGLVPPIRRGLEIKSHYKPITHLKAIEGEVPKAHFLQAQFGMACTAFTTWHLADWCPYLPPRMQLHVREIKRDDRVIAELVVAIQDAEIEVAAKVRHYQGETA